MLQANSLRKEQLHEVAILRDEEKRKAKKSEEELVSLYYGYIRPRFHAFLCAIEKGFRVHYSCKEM